jgi:6,7-dimethyl-8-ribityllumazine synthase
MFKETLCVVNTGPVKLAIVVSQFNSEITTQLLEGAKAALAECSQGQGSAEVLFVPGAFEIPQTVARLLAREQDPARRAGYQGILTLGCLIKGHTDHYELLSTEVASKIAKLSVQSPIPVCFGVLATRSTHQAMERANPSELDKGGETMRALLGMVNLYGELFS